MSFLKKMLFGAPKEGAAPASDRAAAPAPRAKEEALRSMAALQEQISTIRKKIDHNELKIQQEEAKIKDILRDCGGDAKKKERRMPELKRHLEAKKRLETVNQQESGKEANLQSMVDQLQDAISNQEMFSAMQQGTATLKKIAPNADDVRDVADEARDTMADVQESTAALSEPMNPAAEVDDDELMAALGELEEVAFEEKAKKDAQLPDIPRPAVSLPDAGKKQVPQKQAALSKAEQDDEDELERLAAEMN